MSTPTSDLGVWKAEDCALTAEVGVAEAEKLAAQAAEGAR